MHAVRTPVEPARLAASPDDYARFGLTKGQVEPWEDGLRLDPGAPDIEWWYFDALLDDGAKLSVIHCTKDASRPHQPLEPLIEIDLDLSKDGCDVRIGEYVFTGDLHEYHITGKAEDLSAEVRLESITEPWRPETGHLVFGPDGETIFAWAPCVPMGRVTATYTIGSEVHETTGMGYHDHNWMNQEMGRLIDHWYWGRGQVGPYSFVTAYITTAEKYGYAEFPFYMLARDGRVVADDGAKVTFSKSGSEIDHHTGKPIPDMMSFEFRDGEARYVLTYRREHTLVSQTLIELASGVQKLMAELIRYPGGYLRFTGPVTLDRYQGGEVVEHHEQLGSFEQCYWQRVIHGDR
jgi:hypothetical protein